MSRPIPATLYRIAALAGGGSAVILLINAAKRAEVIPTSAFTQLVAPLAQILALVLVTALYLAFGRRTGTFGLVAFLLNAFSLAALVGVEFVINLVFADLPDHTIDALRGGTLGVALTVASVSFLLGTLTYVAAMLRSQRVPTAPLALYAVGAVPVALRALVPRLLWTSGSSPWPWASAGSPSGSSAAPATSSPGATTQTPTYRSSGLTTDGSPHARRVPSCRRPWAALSRGVVPVVAGSRHD
jgi:hypothetical protein